MSWSLLNEVGLDYAGEESKGESLSFPVVLERAHDGTYLIVDEIGLRKNLPVRAGCRTLHVDIGGEVLFDFLARGMSDAYGRLMEGWRMALLRRTSWEIQILAPSGAVERRSDLSSLTPRMPRLLSWTHRRTFLIACLDNVYDVDLLEIDEQGRLLWFLPKRDAIGCPAAIQLVGEEGVLVADEFGHVVMVVGRDGTIAWQYGRKRHPSAAPKMLSNPVGARQVDGGRRLIADTRNHLIVRVDGDDATTLDVGFELCCPTYVDYASDGSYLVCDAGNERVLELDAQMRIRWQFGRTVADSRSLSYPRSVEMTSNGSFLVADTANDRVVVISERSVEVCYVDDPSPLFWPRCVRRTSAGTLLIADGRNSRILEVTKAGESIRTLTRLENDTYPSLDDPHDVRLLDNGRLLVTDAAQNLVVETDWQGRVSWMANGGSAGLKDPHSAQTLDEGDVLITDTGRGRVLWVDASGEVVRELDSLFSDRFHVRLNRPRYAEQHPDGTVLIVDSGNNRVLAATAEGRLLWELREIPGSRLKWLSQPRWAKLLGPDEVIVSDHSNHRILHLSYEPDDG